MKIYKQIISSRYSWIYKDMRHIRSFSEHLLEKAIPFAEILRLETQQGVISVESRVNNSTSLRLAIYDFDDEKILAYTSVRKWDGDDYWHVDMSVAEKDYGPDVYDMALMSVYPEPLSPSTTIKPAAQKVWKFYFHSRPDVKKETLKPGDDDYIEGYTETPAGPVMTDPEMLKILNTRFYLEPTQEFNELVDRGNEYAGEYGVNFGNILSKAKKHFWNKYNAE